MTKIVPKIKMILFRVINYSIDKKMKWPDWESVYISANGQRFYITKKGEKTYIINKKPDTKITK